MGLNKDGYYDKKQKETIKSIRVFIKSWEGPGFIGRKSKDGVSLIIKIIKIILLIVLIMILFIIIIFLIMERT